MPAGLQRLHRPAIGTSSPLGTTFTGTRVRDTVYGGPASSRCLALKIHTGSNRRASFRSLFMSLLDRADFSRNFSNLGIEAPVAIGATVLISHHRKDTSSAGTSS